MKNFAVPFAAGLIGGYALMLIISMLAALTLSFTDVAGTAAPIAALAATAAGAFLCGRIAGKQRRRKGLKTGLICGTAFILPLILLSFIFGRAEGVLLTVKSALALGFAMAGGVNGVNCGEK